jgi:multiple sugar transport system permease protein
MRRKANLAGYTFLLPWLVGFLGLTAGPMLYSLYLAFTDYDLLTSPKWVGVRNFVDMFAHDPRYLSALKVTTLFVVTSVPLKLLVALGVAVLLNAGMRHLDLYRAIYFLPSLLGTSVAVAIMWKQVFGATGLTNHVLAWFGVHGPSWISDPHYALWTLVALRRQQLWHITLPQLTPLIFFNLVLQIIVGFQSFNSAFIISGGTGGPTDSTLLYTLYLYQKGFTDFRMGYASAMAWVLLVIIAVLTAANFKLGRRWVHYEDGGRL